MNTLIIVQARMNSTRLPGKVLKVVCGKTLLEHLINRLKNVKNADQLVIATTKNDTDYPIVKVCEKLNCSFYRGSEDDVLSRYYETAIKYKGDIIVRITSDCPVIDPHVVDKVINYYLEHKNEFDYVSNTLKRTYPRGMDTEVFSFKTLEEAHFEATQQPDREHVTPFITKQPQRYRHYNISYVKDLSHHRWTVDTTEDLRLITKIFENLYIKTPEFNLKDILCLMDVNPDWKYVNAHIKQKKC